VIGSWTWEVLRNAISSQVSAATEAAAAAGTATGAAGTLQVRGVCIGWFTREVLRNAISSQVSAAATAAGTMHVDLQKLCSCCSAMPHLLLVLQVADGSHVAAGAVLGGSSRHYAS
jgi:hypothetical protein